LPARPNLDLLQPHPTRRYYAPPDLTRPDLTCLLLLLLLLLLLDNDDDGNNNGSSTPT